MRKSVPFLGLLTLVIIGCNSSEQTNQDHAANYLLEIVDSLQIDYLGDLWIMDYDSSSQRYLAWGNGDREVLVLNEIGGISSTFNFPTDGPDALPGWINPIGLNNGGIEFMTAPNGFYSYDLEGNRVWSYKTPFEFYYLNGIKGDPFYSLGEDIAFLRPEKGELDWDNLADLIKNLYKSPILEVLDTASHTSRFTMPFPPNSIYNDGNYHFWTFPAVHKFGSEWILYFRNEFKFWIYQEKEGEVLFQKEVSLDVSDTILEKGVPFENAEDYNELTEYSFPGSIQEIYRTEDKVLVIYHKGVSEDHARQFDRNSPEGRRKIEWLKKRYLTVFDLNFNQLQKDIPVPQGLIFTTILRENGEVLALKHQDFFESEDDYVIYYKLKLIELDE